MPVLGIGGSVGGLGYQAYSTSTPGWGQQGLSVAAISAPDITAPSTATLNSQHQAFFNSIGGSLQPYPAYPTSNTYHAPPSPMPLPPPPSYGGGSASAAAAAAA